MSETKNFHENQELQERKDSSQSDESVPIRKKWYDQSGEEIISKKYTLKLGQLSEDTLGDRRNISWDEFVRIMEGGTLVEKEELVQETPAERFRKQCACNYLTLKKE